MRTLIALMALVASVAIGQTTYQIPFASSGNTIELAVANTAAVPLAGVKVVATELPSWLKFVATEQRIALLKAQQEIPATFTFSVDKTAPVQKSQTLKFVVSALTGEKWVKEITVAVAAPEKFEVFQNYPNPFNPTTTITYSIPTAAHVQLSIYDALGRHLVTLIDEHQEPGIRTKQFDGAGLASGMYFYRLQAGAYSETRKLLLMK